MIVTRKKPVEQVLAMLHGVRRVALVGCASCAAACQTGGEKELEQMRQLLQEQGVHNGTDNVIFAGSRDFRSPGFFAFRRSGGQLGIKTGKMWKSYPQGA